MMLTPIVAALLLTPVVAPQPPLPDWQAEMLARRPKSRASVHRSGYPEDAALRAAGAGLAQAPISAPVVVGMTTTPTRIAHVEPAILSLLNQSQPCVIVLNVPDRYNERRNHWNGKRVSLPPWLAALDKAARRAGGPRGAGAGDNERCASSRGPSAGARPAFWYILRRTTTARRRSSPANPRPGRRVAAAIAREAIAIAGRRPSRTPNVDRSQVGTAEALRADAAVADAVGAEDPDRVVVVAADDDHEWEPFALARAHVREAVRAIDGAPAPGDAPVRGLRAGRGDAQGRGLRRGRGRLDLLQLRVPAVRARRPGAAPFRAGDERTRVRAAGSDGNTRAPPRVRAVAEARSQVEPRREPAGEPDLRRPGRRLCGNQPPIWDVPTKL
jgi:hypothetical protein